MNKSEQELAEDVAPLRAFNLTRKTLIASRVELAGTGAKRTKGLLGRTGMSSGEALWIVPCEAVHTFGMKFALDLIYLDRERRIRKIRRNVPPWRLSGCLTAHSVLELAAGSIDEAMAQPGDMVDLGA
ncbi:MAG TPA: DUF192 domain-containing protein [Terracidiphilus sp.]|jgi:uncharacterized membrane protein (UPF0127 family)|nr:DUF192 domain-containing protein [Terracidiphilus sp.]